MTSLKLCAAAGMVRLGAVVLDGTKLAANAAELTQQANDLKQLRPRLEATGVRCF